MITCSLCSGHIPAGKFCATCGALIAPTPGMATAAIEVPAQAGSYGPAPAPTAAPFPTNLPFYAPTPEQRVGDEPTTPQLPYVPSPVGSNGDTRTRGAVALTVAALAVGGFFLFGQGAKHNLTGDLTVTAVSDDSLEPGGSCTGTDAFSDIGSGTQVVLEDGKGSTLGTTELSSGVYDGQSCLFHFSLSDVPKASFYVLKTGNGDQRFSYGRLVKQHWAAHLSLGDG